MGAAEDVPLSLLVHSTTLMMALINLGRQQQQTESLSGERARRYSRNVRQFRRL